MTEHGERHVVREAAAFRIGESVLHWNGTKLTLDIHERCAPLPRPLHGKVTINTEGLGAGTFLIDDRGHHRWRPLAPMARIHVDFEQPNLQWSGEAYFDHNEGDELLDQGFTFWDWSRTMIDQEKTAILYNTDMVGGTSCLSAFLANKHGEITEMEPPPPALLPATPYFRIHRRTRAEPGIDPRVVKTLEDTPFYSRSLIETPILGKPRWGIHESLTGPRLRSRIVQSMLKFRMPRKP